MKILSGGQAGVDRAALDAALACGLSYGGWCPRGGWAEDFPSPPGLLQVYPQLWEAPSPDPAARTRLNVAEADATLILCADPAESPGTTLTIAEARARRRPCLVVDPAAQGSLARARAWLAGLGPLAALNVAGPRESEAPGIYLRARALLDPLLRGRAHSHA